MNCESLARKRPKWTGLSRRSFAADAVRLQVYAGLQPWHFMRTLAMPKTEELTSLREKPDQDRR
jgi:hypothetical protein